MQKGTWQVEKQQATELDKSTNIKIFGKKGKAIAKYILSQLASDNRHAQPTKPGINCIRP